MSEPTPEERARRVAASFPATPYIDAAWESKLTEEIRAAVEAEREACATLDGVPFGDWLLDWFGQNPVYVYEDDNRHPGFTFAQIADLSRMLERRFAAAIRARGEASPTPATRPKR